jgi:WS/DGAT/MGAT family acyltransferase
MKAHEPLSGVDAAWLRMDDPTNLMTITAVLVLEDRMDLATLKDLIEERLLGFLRFRQRVRETNGTPRWELDPNFDLDQHVRRSALPGDAGEAELKERVSALMSQPLDRAKPLWDMELIEDYKEGSAVIVRLHHCIGDGIALVQVLLSLTDEHFDPDRFPRDESDADSFLPKALRGAWNNLKGAAATGERILAEGTESLLNPSHAFHRAKQGMSLGAALSKLALLGADSDTVFKGDLKVGQKATWSDPVDLATVKRMAEPLDAKVNDILLAAVAGALRYYLQQHDEPTDGVVIRALLPVNLRPLEQAFKLGNRFGLVYIDFPVGIDDRIKRVLDVQAQMGEIKCSSEAVAAFGVLETLGHFPAELEAQAVQLFSSKASVVMTNVPGPQEQLHMKGCRVQNVMPWVPRAGRIGMGVSVFSYNGEVRLGIACDAHLVPDPDVLVDGFEREFEKLADDLLPE